MEYGMQGQVALVTGAARDVGRQIALGLAAEGATVAVNYNSSPKEAEAVVAASQPTLIIVSTPAARAAAMTSSIGTPRVS